MKGNMKVVTNDDFEPDEEEYLHYNRSGGIPLCNISTTLPDDQFGVYQKDYSTITCPKCLSHLKDCGEPNYSGECNCCRVVPVGGGEQIWQTGIDDVLHCGQIRHFACTWGGQTAHIAACSFHLHDIVHNLLTKHEFEAIEISPEEYIVYKIMAA